MSANGHMGLLSTRPAAGPLRRTSPSRDRWPRHHQRSSGQSWRFTSQEASGLLGAGAQGRTLPRLTAATGFHENSSLPEYNTANHDLARGKGNRRPSQGRYHQDQRKTPRAAPAVFPSLAEAVALPGHRRSFLGCYGWHFPSHT